MNPALCYPSSCPPYKFPTKQDLEEEDQKAEAEREKWFLYFNKLKIQKKPQTEVEKCQEYCRAVQQAEAEKCRIAREKIAYALKLAGCPSKVLPPLRKKKKSSQPTKPAAKKAAATKS